MTDEGESASLVALLDVPNPALISNLSRVELAQFRKTYLSHRLRKYGRQLMRGDIKAFISRGLGFITSRARRFFVLDQDGISDGEQAVAGKTARRRSRLHDGVAGLYSEAIYKASGVFSGARSWTGVLPRSLMGWDTYAMGGVQVHVVPGRHTDMLRTPYVRAIADKLTTYLDNGCRKRVCRSQTPDF